MRKKFGRLFRFIFWNIWVNISRVWLKRRMRKELKHAKLDGEDKTNLAQWKNSKNTTFLLRSYVRRNPNLQINLKIGVLICS